MILHLKKMKKMLLWTIRPMEWSVCSHVAQTRISALSVSFWFAIVHLVVL
jgi:hypothetical protein